MKYLQKSAHQQRFVVLVVLVIQFLGIRTSNCC